VKTQLASVVIEIHATMGARQPPITTSLFSVKETEFVNLASISWVFTLPKLYSHLIAPVKFINSLYLTFINRISVGRHIDSVGMEKKRSGSGGAHSLALKKHGSRPCFLPVT